MSTSAALIAILAAVAPPPLEHWRCEFSSGFECTPQGGCVAARPTWMVVFDPDTSTYQRCVREAVCTLNSVYWRGGAGFRYFQLDREPADQIDLTVSSDLGATEVFRSGHTVLLSYGRCTPFQGDPAYFE